MEFGEIVKLVKFNRFLRYRVDIGKNLKPSKFFKFQFGVKVVYYRVFLLAIGGGK